MKHTADVNAIDGFNMTPLLLAVQKGNLEMVKSLLGHNVNMNQFGKDGEIPLIKAIQQEYTEIGR